METTKQVENEYEKAAREWAEKHGVKMTTTFLYHGKRPDDDDNTRDVYQIILICGTRSRTIEFGQSLNDSGLSDSSRGKYWSKEIDKINRSTTAMRDNMKRRKRKLPTMYDVIAHITKHDPGSHEEFCANYGYDTDSRKGLELYVAVQKEYHDFLQLCGGNNDMLSEAQEIA